MNEELDHRCVLPQRLIGLTEFMDASNIDRVTTIPSANVILGLEQGGNPLKALGTKQK